MPAQQKGWRLSTAWTEGKALLVKWSSTVLRWTERPTQWRCQGVNEPQGAFAISICTRNIDMVGAAVVQVLDWKKVGFQQRSHEVKAAHDRSIVEMLHAAVLLDYAHGSQDTASVLIGNGAAGRFARASVLLEACGARDDYRLAEVARRKQRLNAQTRASQGLQGWLGSRHIRSQRAGFFSSKPRTFSLSGD